LKVVRQSDVLMSLGKVFHKVARHGDCKRVVSSRDTSPQNC